MNEISLTHLLDVAICAAEAAGKHALQHKDRRTEVVEAFSHDLKLVLDMECQKEAEGVIASEFPEHSVLGEEDVTEIADQEYEWIIDPIDGTLNYAHGFPYWCCSVAVRHNNKILAGCVHAPEFGDFYTAHIEEPAKRNGESIGVSGTRHLQEALVFTGLSKNFEEHRGTHLEMLRMLALNTQKIRINGAAALDLCRVADGVSDGFFEAGIHIWDFAAAGLIAEQAGATLSLFPQKNSTYTVLCANAHLIDGLRAIHEKCI
jgi:myo-inositol-1(or 4)-monophosphatase